MALPWQTFDAGRIADRAAGEQANHLSPTPLGTNCIEPSGARGNPHKNQAGEPAASAPAPRPKTDLDYKRGWLESALKELNAPANAGFIEPQLERALTTAIAIELDRQGRGEPMVSDGSTQDYSQPGTQFFTMNARVYSFRPGEYPAYDQLAKFRELRGAWAQKAAKYPLNSPEGNPANEPQLPADLIESVKELARQTLAQTAR